MRWFFSLVVLFVLVGCGSVNRDPDGLTMPQACNPLEDRPYVIGWVDGHPVRLAVDTGAAQGTLLFSGAVDALGGRLRGKGALQTTNLEVVVYEGQPQSEDRQTVAVVPQTNFQGLVGWPMIRNFVWNINFPKKEHKFTDSVPFLVRQRNSLKILPQGEIAYLSDKRGHRIALDTGAPYGIYLNKKHWEEWKAAHPYAFVTLYDGYSPAAGGHYVRECSRCDVFTIGDVKFHNVVICESFVDREIMGLDHDIDIILGLESFMSRDVWIDGKNHEVYFGSDDSAERKRAPLNLVGVCFQPRADGRLTYDLVVKEGSVAWKSGLRTGDRLVSLGGARYPDYALMQYATQHPGAKMSVVISRRGRIKRYKWEVPTEAAVTPKPPVSQPPFTEFLDLPVVVEDAYGAEKAMVVPIPLMQPAPLAPQEKTSEPAETEKSQEAPPPSTPSA